VLIISAHFPNDKPVCINSLFCRVRHGVAAKKQISLPQEIPVRKCMQLWTALAAFVGPPEQRGPTYLLGASYVRYPNLHNSASSILIRLRPNTLQVVAGMISLRQRLRPDKRQGEPRRSSSERRRVWLRRNSALIPRSFIIVYVQIDSQSFQPITPRVPCRNRSCLDITFPH